MVKKEGKLLFPMDPLRTLTAKAYKLCIREFASTYCKWPNTVVKFGEKVKKKFPALLKPVLESSCKGE